MSVSPKIFSKDCVDFINDANILSVRDSARGEPSRVREILAKAKEKQALRPKETAELLAADSPELTEEIFDAARELKRRVYGNRIVLFAPLYIGSYCVNECAYCAFRAANKSTKRVTLDKNMLVRQVEALEDKGHKRLIMVFGEHPAYTPEFMAESVRTAYAVKRGHGEIRRININAAPLNPEGFKTVKAAKIGTYQIFQETYHHETYGKMHPADTPKGDYLYRLDGLSRAYEAACDDVGIGALFGLYDWKFEVLGLVTHSLYLQNRFGVGPHTISFPRVRPAHGVQLDPAYFVKDDEFKRLVAILRLSVPYTGLILTAREPAHIRREVMGFGVSQIDAGTRVELGGYTDGGEKQKLDNEQFEIGDTRSLDEILRELVTDGYIPSFCTSCYRVGRTGQQFMEYAVPGFIQRFCTPNALLTLAEYLEDYASEETKRAAVPLFEKELESFSDEKLREELRARIGRIRAEDARDLYF